MDTKYTRKVCGRWVVEGLRRSATLNETLPAVFSESVDILVRWLGAAEGYFASFSGELASASRRLTFI